MVGHDARLCRRGHPLICCKVFQPIVILVICFLQLERNRFFCKVLASNETRDALRHIENAFVPVLCNLSLL